MNFIILNYFHVCKQVWSDLGWLAESVNAECIEISVKMDGEESKDLNCLEFLSLIIKITSTTMCKNILYVPISQNPIKSSGWLTPSSSMRNPHAHMPKSLHDFNNNMWLLCYKSVVITNIFSLDLSWQTRVN